MEGSSRFQEQVEEEIKQSQANLSDENEEDEEDELESAQIKGQDMIFNPESQLRNWLKSRGKDHCIDFEDEELKQLRIYFDSLDDDGSEEIGVDELEDPLIALGLVDNRNQVQKIVDLVDEDGSGQIEFPEFLQIIKGGSNAKEGAKDDGTGAIYQFFKDLTSGRMNIDGNDNIPFSLFISSQRRRKILQSMWAQDEKVKKDGEKILGNYKKQLAEKLAREQAEKMELQSMSRPTTGSRQTKRSAKMGQTASSIASSRKEKESQAQKYVQEKLNEISTFNGDPPDAEILLAILNQKKVYD